MTSVRRRSSSALSEAEARLAEAAVWLARSAKLVMAIGRVLLVEGRRCVDSAKLAVEAGAPRRWVVGVLRRLGFERLYGRVWCEGRDSRKRLARVASALAWLLELLSAAR